MINVYKYPITCKTMKNTLLVIDISLVMIILLVAVTISPNVMAKQKPLEPGHTCNVLSGGQYVQCCQSFWEDGDAKVYCTLCENTKPPSNCTDRFEPRDEGSNNEVTLPDVIPQKGLNLSTSNQNDNEIVK